MRKGNATAEVGDQFKLLVSNVVDYAIFMLDSTGHIVTWNEGAERIKGYPADEIIGRHFSVFYPAQEAQIHKPDWRSRSPNVTAATRRKAGASAKTARDSGPA